MKSGFFYSLQANGRLEINDSKINKLQYGKWKGVYYLFPLRYNLRAKEIQAFVTKNRPNLNQGLAYLYSMLDMPVLLTKS